MLEKFIKPTNDDLEKMTNDLDLKGKQNMKQESIETDLFLVRIGDLWVEKAPLLEHDSWYPYLNSNEIIATDQIGSAQKFSRGDACEVANRFHGTVYQEWLVKQ